MSKEMIVKFKDIKSKNNLLLPEGKKKNKDNLERMKV